MKRYEGKKVVIVGDTSGMGLATAKMLLDGGASVLATGRSKEGLESAQKELGNEAIVVFERRAVVGGPRRTRLASEGPVGHTRPAVRQCRLQHPSAS